MFTYINVNPTPTWNQGNSTYTSIRPNLRLNLDSIVANNGQKLYGELYLFATKYVDTAASSSTPCSWTVQIWYSASGTDWGGAAATATRSLTHAYYHGWNNSELHGTQGVWHTFEWGSEPTVYTRVWCQSSVHNWEVGYWQQTAYAQRAIATAVYIHNGTSWAPYIPHVHDGSAWKNAVAYTHDGSKWCMSHG